jgi:hypothetical protein
MIVYRPQGDREKTTFLLELQAVRSVHPGPWLVAGDFNLIYNVVNKKNQCLNRHLMGRFCRCLHDLKLSMLHLYSRLHNWSNQQTTQL